MLRVPKELKTLDTQRAQFPVSACFPYTHPFMSAMTESYWRRTDAAMRVWERFLIIRAGFGVFTHSGPIAACLEELQPARSGRIASREKGTDIISEK